MGAVCMLVVTDGPAGTLHRHCGNKISFRAVLWFFSRIPQITIDRWFSDSVPDLHFRFSLMSGEDR